MESALEYVLSMSLEGAALAGLGLLVAVVAAKLKR